MGPAGLKKRELAQVSPEIYSPIFQNFWGLGRSRPYYIKILIDKSLCNII